MINNSYLFVYGILVGCTDNLNEEATQVSLHLFLNNSRTLFLSIAVFFLFHFIMEHRIHHLKPIFIILITEIFQLAFLEPILSGLNNRLLSFQHSDFSDIVDLRTISEYCSNLTFLAVNAAAVVISGETYPA